MHTLYPIAVADTSGSMKNFHINLKGCGEWLFGNAASYDIISVFRYSIGIRIDYSIGTYNDHKVRRRENGKGLFI